MPRSARKALGGFIFHCLNRGVGRRKLFLEDGDYAAFERVLAECLAAEASGVAMLAYCLMPTHGSTERAFPTRRGALDGALTQDRIPSW